MLIPSQKIFIVLSIIETCFTYTFLNKKTSHLKYEQWDAKTSGQLNFKFKTHNPYGLLLYTDNSLEPSYLENFIVIKLDNGKLYITIQMGGEDYRSRRTEQVGDDLNDLEWHYIELYRNKRITKLKLDSHEEIIIINDGEIDILDLNSGLYFGGISTEFTSRVIERSILALPRFIGCMDDIEFSKTNDNKSLAKKDEKTKGEFSNSSKARKSRKRTRRIQSTEVEKDYILYRATPEKIDVKEGCINMCANYTCPNKGRCINHFVEAKCDCIGTGFHGRDCEIESDSLEFKKNEYIAVNVDGSLRTTTENEIVFRFKTNQANGLFMAALSGNDHLMIELHSTVVRLSMNLGGGHHILEINTKPFNDGRWHSVEFQRKGIDISMQVDRSYFVRNKTPGIFRKFDLRKSLYIGGHPTVEKLRSINSLSNKNFSGCLQHVYFNSIDIIYKTLNTRSSRFQKYGNISEGCTVKPKRNVMLRETPGSSVSKSGKVDDDNEKEVDNKEKPKIEKSKTKDKSTKRKIEEEDEEKKLSKKTIIWIIVGLIVGSILIIITIVLIVNSVRNRYSDIVFTKNYKNNNELLHSINRRHKESIVYTPRNGKIILEPELV